MSSKTGHISKSYAKPGARDDLTFFQRQPDLGSHTGAVINQGFQTQSQPSIFIQDRDSRLPGVGWGCQLLCPLAPTAGQSRAGPAIGLGQEQTNKNRRQALAAEGPTR